MAEPWQAMRSGEQNKLLQAACRDLAEGLKWDGVRLSQDDFRHLIAADILGQRPVRGIHGGVVLLGGSSRKLTVTDCTDAITLAFSIGDDPESYGLRGQHRVAWSESVSFARGISPNESKMADQYGDC